MQHIPSDTLEPLTMLYLQYAILTSVFNLDSNKARVQRTMRLSCCAEAQIAANVPFFALRVVDRACVRRAALLFPLIVWHGLTPSLQK